MGQCTGARAGAEALCVHRAVAGPEQMCGREGGV